MEFIDLSMPIYEGMPVHHSQPPVRIQLHATHEEWDGEEHSPVRTPASFRLEMGEHTGTHVDAINHMGKEFKGRSIDTMGLDRFYTSGCCLDVSFRGCNELISAEDLEIAEKKLGAPVEKGETVLLYTDHFRKHFNSSDWPNGPGLSVEAARWLGQKQIAAFGVETLSPGIRGVSNREVHRICGEMDFTHYENLVNLHCLTGRGRFRFVGFPLPIRGGTGSPVRAVAIFE